RKERSLWRPQRAPREQYEANQTNDEQGVPHEFKSDITLELTRRRDFTNASPDQLCYKTRSRRSRPTICYAAANGFPTRTADKGLIAVGKMRYRNTSKSSAYAASNLPVTSRSNSFLPGGENESDSSSASVAF